MKKIILIVVFVFCHNLNAQEIKPIKVTVERGIPGESFSKTTLGLEFWIQEYAQVVAVDQEESKVIELKTNDGESLLGAHREAVEARKKHVEEQAKKGRYMFSSRSEQLIDFNSSIVFIDTLGFKVVLDSWAIPSKRASNLDCKMNIVYHIVNETAAEQSIITKDVVLSKSKELMINGKEVILTENGYSTRNGKKLLYYQFETSNLNVLVQKIEQVNEKEEILENFNSSSGNGRVSFNINENKIGSPIHLKFTFKPLIKKSVKIEQMVSLGL